MVFSLPPAPPKGCFIIVEDRNLGKCPGNCDETAWNAYLGCFYGGSTDSCRVAKPFLGVAELEKGKSSSAEGTQRILVSQVSSCCTWDTKLLYTTPQQFFCDFRKLAGQDECHYWSYELMMERRPTYRMQVETRPSDQGTRGMHRGYQGCGWGQGGGWPGRG